MALPCLRRTGLAQVADALALVRLRLPQRADRGGKVADHLLVDPLDDDVLLVGAR